ncbi:uncharacterized protein A4U43_C10F7070 [Asparagus officinalis]|uniref:Uncharacterized protein n=1 Tax=Asparagus officinalis TaxID=4686 RepID=A0A5P1E187_ASPOF|nr:uncharacterized protein A4U43_C10F7070 [Asparagus officinalis]
MCAQPTSGGGPGGRRPMGSTTAARRLWAVRGGGSDQRRAGRARGRSVDPPGPADPISNGGAHNIFASVSDDDDVAPKKVKEKKPKKPKVTMAEAAAKINADNLAAHLVDNSGKATIFLRINGEDTSVISSTLRFNIKIIEYQK